ncbi:MAG: thiamine phosphate synthase [Lachnospiraceae bacterium]|nr:thiamine phosphate synthase [Lachnospiraceae bacterium]
MSDILCVTNRKLCREDFLSRIKRIASCHPAGIILREKDMNPEEYKELAEAVMKICEENKVKCILHSFTEVAISLHAQAIHLPLPLLEEMTQERRSCFTDLGASCHNVEDALKAQALGCTYITAGHVFETDCKKGLPGKGPDFLREVCAFVDIPVYGIGGIDSDNIALVRQAGAGGACLMSSLMTSENVAELLKAMEG